MKIFSVFGLLTCLTLAGCPSGDDSPKTQQAVVSGTVTYDGKPIKLDSNVVFTSEAEGAIASGMVDSIGNFTLRGSIPSVGIPVGRYKVTIHPPNAATAAAPVAVGDNDAYKKMMAANMKPKKGDSKEAQDSIKEIPMIFRDKAKTPIIIELKAGDNKFPFDLLKLTPSK